MSHLITRLASYVAACSLAARNARSTSSCHIFHEHAYQERHWRNVSDRIRESHLAPSSWPAVRLARFLSHDQPIFQMEKEINKYVLFPCAHGKKKHRVHSLHYPPSREDNKAALIADNHSKFNDSARIHGSDEKLSRDVKNVHSTRKEKWITVSVTWCHDSTSWSTRLISFALGNAHTHTYI